MKLMFLSEYIKGNEIIFWSVVILIVIMIVLSIIFARKETKNESK